MRLINFGRGDIETVIQEMISCERIVSSSLHGLILADAYGIPNAWLDSEESAGGSRPNGGTFKYYDYFASVGKLRAPQRLRSQPDASLRTLLEELTYDGTTIDFDPKPLLDAAPFLRRVGGDRVDQNTGPDLFAMGN